MWRQIFKSKPLLDDGVFTDTSVSNPLAINFYVLGYDSNKKLALINNATKTNLLNYMSFYRILTDAINIKNAYIVNIAIDFELVVKPNFNANEVLFKLYS